MVIEDGWANSALTWAGAGGVGLYVLAKVAQLFSRTSVSLTADRTELRAYELLGKRLEGAEAREDSLYQRIEQQERELAEIRKMHREAVDGQAACERRATDLERRIARLEADGNRTP